jgi:catechol-2,3-dioxygenase
MELGEAGEGVLNLHSLDYVILLCDDLALMKFFYHETLGFPIERDWGEWIEMRVGAVLLTLRRRGRSYDGPRTYGSAGVQLAFRVPPAEVDTWHAVLLQKEVQILEPPRDKDYGQRTLFFKDPEGNILEIYAEI